MSKMNYRYNPILSITFKRTLLCTVAHQLEDPSSFQHQVTFLGKPKYINGQNFKKIDTTV